MPPYLEVQKDVVELVNQTKKSGKKVFAVGTTATSMKTKDFALETAFTYGDENGYAGYTKLKTKLCYLYILVLSLKQLIDS